MDRVCCDQYDHPLLWCESKRRAEGKRIADEQSALAQQKREQIEIEKIRECDEVSPKTQKSSLLPIIQHSISFEFDHFILIFCQINFFIKNSSS